MSKCFGVVLWCYYCKYHQNGVLKDTHSNPCGACVGFPFFTEPKSSINDKRVQAKLELAVRRNSVVDAEQAIVQGAAINFEYSDGRTILEKSKSSEMRALLKKYGAKKSSQLHLFPIDGGTLERLLSPVNGSDRRKISPLRNKDIVETIGPQIEEHADDAAAGVAK